MVVVMAQQDAIDKEEKILAFCEKEAKKKRNLQKKIKLKVSEAEVGLQWLENAR